MKALNQHLVLISAETETDNNNELLEKALYAHNQINVPVNGCYNGVPEEAFCVVLGTDIREVEQQVTNLIKLGVVYGQESILYIDNEKGATLIYCETGERVSIGTWTRTNNPSANYSLIAGQYYEVI